MGGSTTYTERAPTDEIVAPRTEELATERGETVIAPTVVAKIARQAASEVDGVEVSAAPGLRGLLSKVGGGSAAGGSSASVGSRRAALDLHVSVIYPRPVRAATAEVRHHVRSRVQELTGYEVGDVDIVVDALPAPTRRDAGRVR